MSDINSPGSNFTPISIHGGLAHARRQLTRRSDDLLYRGKMGAKITRTAATEAAVFCADLCIAAVEHAVGGDDDIVQILKVVGCIASAPGFTQQSQDIDGTFERLIERFGARGHHARTSVGVAELPRGAPIELEMVVTLRM